MAKYFKIKVTSVEEDGTKKEVFKDDVTCFAMLGDLMEKDKGVEMIFNMSAASIASSIECSEVFKKAAKLWTFVDFPKALGRFNAEDFENKLSDSIGGIQ